MNSRLTSKNRQQMNAVQALKIGSTKQVFTMSSFSEEVQFKSKTHYTHIAKMICTRGTGVWSSPEVCPVLAYQSFQGKKKCTAPGHYYLVLLHTLEDNIMYKVCRFKQVPKIFRRNYPLTYITVHVIQF